MNAREPIAWQDTFLNYMRKNKIGATIHLMNGFQIKNAIFYGFDNFVVVIEVDGKQMMLYKHAISSITPAQPVPNPVSDSNKGV